MELTKSRWVKWGCLTALSGLVHFTSGTAGAVVNGDTNNECVFPTAVYIGGCTATLVHPQAITTAQHCAPLVGKDVTFGEEASPTRNPVEITECVYGSSQDGAICKLAEPIVNVPVTPIVFGCEVDKYLKAGQPAWYSGYGNVANTTGTDAKRWAETEIAEVHAGHTVVGPVRGDNPDIPSPCRGDSGGPVYLRADDGSFRLFGTVYQGTTGIPCNGAANFQRVDNIVLEFETQTGLDITPCFDADSGDWAPTEECGGFYADEPGTSSGTWDMMCSNAAVSGASSQCGDPLGGPTGSGGSNGSGGMSGSGGDGAGMMTGGDSGMPPAGSGGYAAMTGGTGGTLPGSEPPAGSGGFPQDVTTGDDDGTPGEESGCACSQGKAGVPRAPGWWSAALLALWGVSRLRRRNTASLS